MSGFGLAPYGLGPYGGTGSVVDLMLVYPIDRYTARAHFNGELLAVSQIGAGDATNPGTWSLDMLNGDLTTARVLTVVLATYRGSGVVDVRVEEALGPYGVLHRLGFTWLKSAAGALVSNPRYGDFHGVALAPGAARTGRDLRNTLFENGSTVGGLVTSSGDYDGQDTVALLRKVVLRRLTTDRGAFAHLPRFGAGLRAKSFVRNLGVAREAVRQQLAQERELADVTVALELSATGVLSVTVRAKMRATGQAAEVTVEVPQP